jgi:hypothetical protein
MPRCLMIRTGGPRHTQQPHAKQQTGLSLSLSLSHTHTHKHTHLTRGGGGKSSLPGSKAFFALGCPAQVGEFAIGQGYVRLLCVSRNLPLSHPDAKIDRGGALGAADPGHYRGGLAVGRHHHVSDGAMASGNDWLVVPRASSHLEHCEENP